MQPPRVGKVHCDVWCAAVPCRVASCCGVLACAMLLAAFHACVPCYVASRCCILMYRLYWVVLFLRRVVWHGAVLCDAVLFCGLLFPWALCGLCCSLLRCVVPCCTVRVIRALFALAVVCCALWCQCVVCVGVWGFGWRDLMLVGPTCAVVLPSVSRFMRRSFAPTFSFFLCVLFSLPKI